MSGDERGITPLSTDSSNDITAPSLPSPPHVPTVSVILPIYNQADHLRTMVHDLSAALTSELTAAGHDFELILVSNACRDDSPAICRELAAESPSVRTIDSKQGGWGWAVRLGLAEARGKWICYTNSARTTPEQLLDVIREALASPKLVVKARRTARGFRRGIGSALYNFECRTLFRLNWADVNGTPKMFPREYSKLLELSRNDDLIDAEFCWLCRRNDYPVREIQMPIANRRGGESTTKLRSAMKMYTGAFKMWMQHDPSFCNMKTTPPTPPTKPTTPA